MDAFEAMTHLINGKTAIVKNKILFPNGFFIKVSQPQKVTNADMLRTDYIQPNLTKIYFIDNEEHKIIDEYYFDDERFNGLDDGWDDWTESSMDYKTAIAFLKLGFSVYRKNWDNKICGINAKGKMHFENIDFEYIPTAEDLNANDWLIDKKI